eukprot:TRINITY_DN49317_c0_g1_i1.p1 TRINITY_DN49317_c0_g1~~TRINITY_DN49317_c0_g1_i1.p1  ORF type:complete len:270 (-),score=41.38 TRINITY_DN49317_c0_g1_i1:108-917(-)
MASLTNDASNASTTKPKAMKANGTHAARKGHAATSLLEERRAVAKHQLSEKAHPHQSQILDFLHHKWFDRVMTFLLIADILLVVGGNLLASEAAGLFIKAYETCHDRARTLERLLECPEQSRSFHEAEKYEHWEHDLTIASVSILSVFLLENAATIVALGRHFFWNRYYVIDLVAVLVSLGFELSEVLQMGGRMFQSPRFLVLARGWRFFRIAHGVMTYDEEGHERHEDDHEADEEGRQNDEKDLEIQQIHKIPEQACQYGASSAPASI